MTWKGPGLVVAVEGPDLFGKSTICAKINEYLQQRGLETYVTCQPEKESEFGALTRKLALSDGGFQEGSMSLWSIFMVNRMRHYEKEIIPRLERGQAIVMDRFFLSTLAYNVIGFPLEKELRLILEMELKGSRGIVPDLVIHLYSSSGQTDPYRALEKRTAKIEKYDSWGDEFKRRLQDKYRAAVNYYRHLESYGLGASAKEILEIDIDAGSDFGVVGSALSKLLVLKDPQQAALAEEKAAQAV